MEYVVYVLDMDGEPLMPTKRFGKVRRMLRDGRAKVVCTKPFTIQLMYEPETKVTQPIVLGIDPGRTNIGLSAVTEDGECLYSAKVTTHNKEIVTLMRHRKAHRQASRRGERLRRKRRTKACGTTTGRDLSRVIIGCNEPIKPKDIINTESKFANRKRPEGWLTPTATQLKRTHLNAVAKVQKILPVTTVVLEINRFAFMAMDNPNIKKWEYQKGPLFGKGSVNDAVDDMQHGRCLLCGKPITQHHHIVPIHENGSNTFGNIVGLCDACHEAVHKDTTTAAKLKKQKAGLNKKYGALSVLNQIIPSLAQELAELFPDETYITNGYSTKLFRDKYSLDKDHNIDAYAIACSVLDDLLVIHPPKACFEIHQYRRHNRARVDHLRERVYKLDGVKVATNRKKRMDQKSDSLEDYYNNAVVTYGLEEAERMRSRLKVIPSYRAYNDMERIQPGAVFIYEGHRYVKSGQQARGTYTRAETLTVGVKTKDCQFIAKNGGLVYV